jgi:hypothetical protein
MKKLWLGIQNKNWGDLIFALAFLALIGALVGYLVSGVTIFAPSLSQKVLIPLILLVVLAALLLVFGSKLGKYAVFMITIYAFIEYLKTQATYLANIIVSIDGSTFSTGFILTSVCFALALILSLTSAIMAPDEVDLVKGKGKPHEIAQ